MSFLPCMFFMNELNRLDAEELAAFFRPRRGIEPLLFFSQPRCSVTHQHLPTPSYDVFSLPSVLPGLNLITPVAPRLRSEGRPPQ